VKEPWFPLVMICTVLLGIWLGIFGPLPKGITDWINQWQNLIAAVVAVGAAGLAYHGAMQQLRQNDRQERNRRSKKHAAVRAMLPLALSQVTEYAQKSEFALLALLPQCRGQILPPGSLIQGLPQILPHETLDVLGELVEYSDDVDVSLVETMVAWIQIYDSRVRGLVRDNADPAGEATVFRLNIENYLIDAASIYAAAAALFDYGRRRGSRPPDTITWENVRGAFRNMRMWDEEHRDLYKIVEGREQRSRGPFDRLVE